MSPDRTLDVNLGVDEHDELDRKIDRALGRVGDADPHPVRHRPWSPASACSSSTRSGTPSGRSSPPACTWSSSCSTSRS